MPSVFTSCSKCVMEWVYTSNRDGQDDRLRTIKREPGSKTMTDATQDISTILRQTREQAGLSLEDIAAELNIRLRFLEAIEAADYEALPPPAFAAGFVRCYATYLGLDGHAISQAFRERMGASATLADLRFPEPVTESRLPGRAAIVSGFVGMAAIYFGWIHDFAGDSQMAHRAADPVPARFAELADADAVSPAGVLAAASYRPAASDAAPAERTAPARQTAPAQAPAAETTAPRAAAASDAVLQERIRLTAAADTWIRVIDGEGRERFSGVLRAGQSWTPAASGRLALSTGNAGALRLAVDGEELAAIGESGDIIEDLPLEPERLKSEYTLAMH